MVDWNRKLKALLHDPPDKALRIHDHESRRDAALRALGLEYDSSLKFADEVAAAMDRLSLPKNCNVLVDFSAPNKPLLKHPLSAKTLHLKDLRDEAATLGRRFLDRRAFNPEVLRRFASLEPKAKYFAVWRRLPELYSLVKLLPADTRVPNHSILDHSDATAAVASARDENDLALFSFKISAAQEFISQARRLSDLWAGSHMLSTLTFEGLKVIFERFGPDSVIFPYLRGQPLLDLHLHKQHLLDTPPDPKSLSVSNLPNTFLALIPHSQAAKLCKEVKEAVLEKFEEISRLALSWLQEQNVRLDEETWQKQVRNSLQVTTVFVKLFDLETYGRVREGLLEAGGEGGRKTLDAWVGDINAEWGSTNAGNFYAVAFELAQSILKHESRLFEQCEEPPSELRKCKMCGVRNAIISKNETKRLSRKYPTLVKEGETLCAVCLTKRIYPEVVKKIFEAGGGGIAPQMKSVVHVAAHNFLKVIGASPHLRELIELEPEFAYEHEWDDEEKIEFLQRKGLTDRDIRSLREELKRLHEVHGEPSRYYAILMMDGDEMGKLLSGEKLPEFKEFIHPAVEACYERRHLRGVLSEKRLLSPSMHMAISRALKYFSVKLVPHVVNNYEGVLIYAGGDDLLALFPTEKVLAAANELRRLFSKDFYDSGEIGMGSVATISAGIVFAHYKYPLYDALDQARSMLEEAKEKYGRDAVALRFLKRGGEPLTAGFKWDCVKDLLAVAESLSGDAGISRRFIYDLARATKILEGEALRSEVRRLLRRRTENLNEEALRKLEGKLFCLLSKFEAHGQSGRELVEALRILCDAYGGGVRE